MGVVLTDEQWDAFLRVYRAAWAVTQYGIHDPRYATWVKLEAAVERVRSLSWA